MLELKEIVEKLEIEPLMPKETDFTLMIKGCYIGDLLSNVMAHACESDLWLTVQTHQNVVAVAQLLNLGGVVFLEGHLPDEDTIKKAQEEKLPLFSTGNSAYEIAGSLYEMGLTRRKP